MRTHLKLLCLAVMLANPAVARAQEAFLDTFETLNRNTWFVSSGWANGPHQNCLWDSNRAKVQDGMLRLTLTTNAKGDREFSCGEVQTNARMGYGTFEARMKVPYAEGVNANMFTFIGAPQDLPHNELDFEFIARDRPVLQTNYHTPEDSENVELHPMEDDGQFRIYSIIWSPTGIRWYIDGILIREATGDPLPDQPQKMYLSLWSTDTLTSWMGEFDATSAPLALAVDWAAFTPLEAGCAFDESVLCVDGVVDR